jgi:hypothetical protein
VKRQASLLARAPGGSPRRRVTIAVSLGVAFFVAVLAACSGQGEGERCEWNNNNDDCSSGLICYKAEQLGASSDRCCPADRQTAAALVCKQGSGGDRDALAPADTGPPPSGDTTDDAGDDAAADQ